MRFQATGILIYLIAALAISACSSSSVELPDRPASDEQPSPELLDESTRITGEPLTLKYDDGGILFSETNDGIISGVRLSDDTRFEFNPASPSLSVNGSQIRLSSAKKVKETDRCRWYRLVTSDRHNEIYIVIGDL